MARRKQKGANFGKRQGSQSQKVEQSRGRNRIILYSVLGALGLILLCGVLPFILFRGSDTQTVAEDEESGFVQEVEPTSEIVEGSADTDSAESGFEGGDAIVTDEDGNVVSEDSGFTSGEYESDEYEGEFELVDGDRPLLAIDPAERDGFYAEYPEMVIDTDLTYEAVLVTEKGDISILLFDDEAPLTVNNFVYLAQEGFYDGTTFHRVLDNFMAQGGDPSGTGAGGPGYRFEDETDNGFAFDTSGLLAMANAGPGTNGSQFFITFVPTPHLNGNHTIFGEVYDGDDVLNALTRRDPNTRPDFTGDLIESVEIYVSEG